MRFRFIEEHGLAISRPTDFAKFWMSANATGQSKAADGHGCSGAYQGTIPSPVWPSSDDRRVERELGLNVGHRRWQLMRENGIRVERSKNTRSTTDSNHAFNIAPNLLNRDFHADGPGQGDISYVGPEKGGCIWLSFLICIPRRVIGWAVSNRMKRLAIRALKMAVALRQPSKGCIHIPIAARIWHDHKAPNGLPDERHRHCTATITPPSRHSSKRSRPS